jgi:hypothetical protein
MEGVQNGSRQIRKESGLLDERSSQLKAGAPVMPAFR